MNRLVADTGPLNYLVQIGAVDFLPALFEGILIPESVLLDDLAARSAARGIGLRVIGTLGVLETASDRNLLFLPDFIEKLRRTNIHLSENLYETVLLRHGHH